MQLLFNLLSRSCQSFCDILTVRFKFRWRPFCLTWVNMMTEMEIMVFFSFEGVSKASLLMHRMSELRGKSINHHHQFSPDQKDLECLGPKRASPLRTRREHNWEVCKISNELRWSSEVLDYISATWSVYPVSVIK